MIAPTISVDTTRAFARFSEAGIPMSVRNSLRQVIPGITRRLASQVDENLSQLKSRSHLQTKTEMVENPTAIYGRVRIEWTGDAAKSFVPQILESGARSHSIYPKSGSALFFFWERMGVNVALRHVNHPGFAGIHYMENAFQALEGEIIATLEQAVKQGAKAA